MKKSANKLMCGVLLLAAGFCGAASAADAVRQTSAGSKSVGLTNLDDADTPPAPPPAAAAPAAPVAPAVAAAASVPAAKAPALTASAAKGAQAKVIRPNEGKPGARSARSAWPDTSKLPPANEPHKLKTARLPKPVLDPIAKTAPKTDGSGVPEPLAQHRLDMIQSAADHDKYINSNSAVSRRYLRVDRATYARENKAP